MTMTARKRFMGGIVAAFMIIALVSGCRGTTPPVRFYTLNAVIEHTAGEPDPKIRQNLAVGVGPMEIPKSIDRPQLVTRTGPNTLSVDEFHRWAGSLHEDFLRALSTNLSILLQTAQVTAYPWEDYFQPVYRIFLDVHRFDGNPGDSIVLDVTCSITDREGRRALYVHKSRIEESVPQTDFGALVSAKNKVIAKLSSELARIIVKLEAGTI